jgi:hypothetical protein
VLQIIRSFILAQVCGPIKQESSFTLHARLSICSCMHAKHTCSCMHAKHTCCTARQQDPAQVQAARRAHSTTETLAACLHALDSTSVVQEHSTEAVHSSSTVTNKKGMPVKITLLPSCKAEAASKAVAAHCTEPLPIQDNARCYSHPDSCVETYCVSKPYGHVQPSLPMQHR